MVRRRSVVDPYRYAAKSRTCAVPLGGQWNASLRKMIAVREAEMAQLSGRTRNETYGAPAIRMPTPSALQEQFGRKNCGRRCMMRTEPASILSTLIESVTIYLDEPE